jgi:hypothetical protein
VRVQRNGLWGGLTPYWKPERMGGKDCTLNRMPDSVKIELCNGMAKGPAFWSAATTLRRTETHVSTKRHNQNSHSKRKVHSHANTRNRTNAHTT